MVYRLTLDVPDEIIEDMEKRKRNNEGTYKDLLIRAYRKMFSVPAPDNEKTEVTHHEKTEYETDRTVAD